MAAGAPWAHPVGMEHIQSQHWPPRRLLRPSEGRVLGGVAAGVADYLDVDVVVVRIVLVALVLAGGAGVPLYLAAWALMPEEGREESLADGLLVGRGIAMATRPAPAGRPPCSRTAPSDGTRVAEGSDRSDRSDDVPAA